MHIVILADSVATQNTGIHQYGKQLVRRILQEMSDHQITLVTPEYLPEFDTPQLIVPVITWLPFHKKLRQLFTFARKIKKIKPDVVIELAHFGPFGLPLSIRQITVIHDLTPISHPSYHDALSVFFHKRLLPGILKKSYKIITNSKTTGKDLNRILGVPVEKLTVAYPSLLPSKQEDSQSESPTDRHAPYFLTVGTIEPRKNHITIIKAFESFCSQNEDHYLVITGKRGWKSAAFYQHYKRSPCRDRIILTEFVTDEQLTDLYTHSFAFVFASAYEGFGLPILEAMQAGIPLLLSRISSSQEIVQENHALWFDPFDSEKLANQMTDLVNSVELQSTLIKASKDSYRAYQALPKKLSDVFE
ncbi:MAG: glycosyltransferase family 4 protein [Saprospiraceae bacterium]|nr:glycosyltransferase family 4 protein [Saprospiraceae bacterium]